MAKSQAPDATETLRKNVRNSGIPLKRLARKAKIGYPRFRRIIRYGQDITLNEAVRVERVLQNAAGESVIPVSKPAA